MKVGDYHWHLWAVVADRIYIRLRVEELIRDAIPIETYIARWTPAHGVVNGGLSSGDRVPVSVLHDLGSADEPRGLSAGIEHALFMPDGRLRTNIVFSLPDWAAKEKPI